MKKYYSFILLATLTVSACATSTKYSLRPDEVEALGRYNAELEAGLSGQSDNSSEQANARQGARVPHPAPYPAGYPTFAVPQNTAAMYSPVFGCSRALSVRIRNRTDYYLQLFLDGQELMVAGSVGGLPHVPPGEDVFICLSRIGRHGLSGVAYANRYGQLVETHRFTRGVAVRGDPRGASLHHNLRITDGMMRMYAVP